MIYLRLSDSRLERIGARSNTRQSVSPQTASVARNLPARRDLCTPQGEKRKNVLSAAASHSGSLKFANATLRRNETSRQRLFHPRGNARLVRKRSCRLRSFNRGIHDPTRFDAIHNFRQNRKLFFFFLLVFCRENDGKQARLLANKIYFINRRANIIAFCAAARRHDGRFIKSRFCGFR